MCSSDLIAAIAFLSMSASEVMMIRHFGFFAGIGVLSTLGLAPLPASNNIGDLSHELAFAQAHSGIAGLRLVPGTEPFNPVL